jgi:DNA mismatch repair protein MutS
VVSWFHEDQLRRGRTRLALKALPDIARALGRLTAGRGSPRDLAQLRDGLAAADALRRELESEADRPPLLDSLLPKLGGHESVVERLCVALVASPPLDSSKGGYIAEGYDAARYAPVCLIRCAGTRSPRWKTDTARRPKSHR